MAASWCTAAPCACVCVCLCESEIQALKQHSTGEMAVTLFARLKTRPCISPPRELRCALEYVVHENGAPPSSSRSVQVQEDSFFFFFFAPSLIEQKAKSSAPILFRNRGCRKSRRNRSIFQLYIRRCGEARRIILGAASRGRR